MEILGKVILKKQWIKQVLRVTSHLRFSSHKNTDGQTRPHTEMRGRIYKGVGRVRGEQKLVEDQEKN